MPNVTVNITDANWTRLEKGLAVQNVPALADDGTRADLATTDVQAWLGLCLKNIVHALERNEAYNKAHTDVDAKMAGETW